MSQNKGTVRSVSSSDNEYIATVNDLKISRRDEEERESGRFDDVYGINGDFTYNNPQNEYIDKLPSNAKYDYYYLTGKRKLVNIPKEDNKTINNIFGDSNFKLTDNNTKIQQKFYTVKKTELAQINRDKINITLNTFVYTDIQIYGVNIANNEKIEKTMNEISNKPFQQSYNEYFETFNQETNIKNIRSNLGLFHETNVIDTEETFYIIAKKNDNEPYFNIIYDSNKYPYIFESKDLQKLGVIDGDTLKKLYMLPPKRKETFVGSVIDNIKNSNNKRIGGKARFTKKRKAKAHHKKSYKSYKK